MIQPGGRAPKSPFLSAIRRTAGVFLAAAALAGCATLPPPAADSSPHAIETPLAALARTDLPVDPAFRIGTLANGMSFIVRQNATPKGTLSVRLDVGAGSLDERDDEQGYAHFVEHMAFNGSTNVPEGEMVRLLERHGLAFGADTNAQTGFERTTYMLELPRNDPALLDTALMLMRETASELTFDQGAVERERGVVLSELRDGQTFSRRNFEDNIAFLYPDALYPRRLPIGLVETIDKATGASLKAFWQREYVPGKTTVVVVGDLPVEQLEAAVRARFDSWGAAPVLPRQGEGTVDPKQKNQTRIFLDPALAERVSASRHGPWLDEPDTIANRQENLFRAVGYAIVNRRFQRLSRLPSPPFRGAGFGTGDVFRIGRTTNLIVDTEDGKWQRGLTTAATEYRRALANGFSEAEVAEQVANIRTGLENAVRGEATQDNRALVGAALALVSDQQVPTTPQSGLQRFEAFAPRITPDVVLAALKREAVPLESPLIRFQGRKAPEGGERALRDTWTSATHGEIATGKDAAAATWAYTDFGPAGTVTSDTVEPLLNIRQIRFANGVRLNLRRTDVQQNQVGVSVLVDGGELMNTKDRPLGTAMASALTDGGLGKHSADELQSITAGHAVSINFDAGGDTFAMRATTTPTDLDFQLQIFAALLSDPGFRPEGASQYRVSMLNMFKRKNATPASAMSTSLGGILSDNDPRFTLQPQEAYQNLSFDDLKAAIGDRLAHGAVEIGVVGDIDEARVIDYVARTFGALPAREDAFRPWDDRRDRPFTAQRDLRVIRHTGTANQALLRWTWPIPDASSADNEAAFRLLDSVVGVLIIDGIREQLGKAYSPGSNASLSQVWRGYGTFTVVAGIDVADVAATRTALDNILDNAAKGIPQDVIDRARQPLLLEIDNALKTNGTWLALVSRAQARPERIERFSQLRARLAALTAEDMRRLVAQYLTPDKAVTVLALPEGAAAPEK